MFAGFATEEIQTLAELRRLVDLFLGDRRFRESVLQNSPVPDQLYDDLGITVERDEVAQLFDITRKIVAAGFKQAPLPRLPVQALWARHQETIERAIGRLSRELSATSNPRLAAWRARQIKRSKSETGTPRSHHFFPFFAFELTEGCSVHCSFCCFAAEKLQGVFSYSPKNAKLWREMLQVGLDLFGNLGKNALCYHATDAFDNPDYLLFLEDFYQLCGVQPQTTTALPFKDLSVTRQLLKMRERNPVVCDRFSILTTGQYRRLFSEFTPLELRHVELVHQNPGGLTTKAHSGRALQQQGRIDRSNQLVNEFYGAQDPLQQRSVECVRGFVVNLVSREIKLVVPCNACDEWPKGYRVLAKGSFRDVQEYRDWLEWAVDSCMPEGLEWDGAVSFRRDLKFEKMNEGFALTACASRYALSGKSWHTQLGDLVAQGDLSRGEISMELGASGVSIVRITATLQKLFDVGLLETN